MEVIRGAWRLFIAVELSEDAIDELVRRQQILHPWSRSGDVRCSHRQSFHLTMRFIGDVERHLVPNLKSELAEVASSSRGVNLRLGANGCFPGPRTPRVLWTGLDGDTERLAVLASQLEGVTTRLGINDASRRFFPHITLARVRLGMPRWVLHDIGDMWTTYRDPGAKVDVSALTLFRSHLKRGVAPRYEKLLTAKLAR